MGKNLPPHLYKCGGKFLLGKSESLVAEGPTGAREELVTDRASCRAAATSKIMLKYLHAKSLHI